MLEGKLYIQANDDEILRDYHQAKRLIQKFNRSDYDNFAERTAIFKELVGSVKENFNVCQPFYCDYGKNIYIGKNFYANHDCIILDVNKVTIGDNVFLAPRVSIFTAGHPIDKDVRNKQLEYGYEVKIGNDCWICGNVVINPGVTIGDNVVIGSGSVVVKDIPSNSIACGNPCKVVRKITEEDKKFWCKQEKEYFDEE